MPLNKEEARNQINNHRVLFRSPEERIQFMDSTEYTLFMNTLLIALGLYEREEEKKEKAQKKWETTGEIDSALQIREECLKNYYHSNVLDDILDFYDVFQVKSVPRALKLFNTDENDDFCGFVINGFIQYDLPKALRDGREEIGIKLKKPKELTYKAIGDVGKWLKTQGLLPDQLHKDLIILCAKENCLTEEGVRQILQYLYNARPSSLNTLVGEGEERELWEFIPDDEDDEIQVDNSLNEQQLLNLIRSFNLFAGKRKDICQVLLTQEILKPVKKKYDEKKENEFRSHYDYVNMLEDFEETLFSCIFVYEYLCLVLLSPKDLEIPIEPDTIRHIDECENHERYTLIKNHGVAHYFDVSEAYISRIRTHEYKKWHDSIPGL